jgi:hypothetical protein
LPQVGLVVLAPTIVHLHSHRRFIGRVQLTSSLLLTGLLASLTSLGAPVAHAGLKESNALGIQAGEMYQSIDQKLTHNVLMIYLFLQLDSHSIG